MLRLTHRVGDKIYLRTDDGRRLDLIVLYAHCDRVELGYAGDRTIEVLRESLALRDEISGRRPKEKKE